MKNRGRQTAPVAKPSIVSLSPFAKPRPLLAVVRSELSDAKLGGRVCQALNFSFAEIILRKDLFELKVFNVRNESNYRSSDGAQQS